MKNPTSKSSEDKAETAAAGGSQVQAATDAAEALGYLGEKADPTPNEHYTVAGVVAGKPTPETDAGAAADAAKAAGVKAPVAPSTKSAKG